jgi:pimeloyl-ACP methyl ester carboxylesterase
VPYFDEELRFYKETVYHIIGGKSHQFPFEKYQKVFPNIRRENVVVVPDAGHWVHFDKPLETIDLIYKALNEIDEKEYSS